MVSRRNQERLLFTTKPELSRKGTGPPSVETLWSGSAAEVGGSGRRHLPWIADATWKEPLKFPLRRVFPPRKIRLTTGRKCGIMEKTGGYGGIGRRDGFRIHWETVKVRALLPASSDSGSGTKRIGIGVRFLLGRFC